MTTMILVDALAKTAACIIAIFCLIKNGCGDNQ